MYNYHTSTGEELDDVFTFKGLFDYSKLVAFFFFVNYNPGRTWPLPHNNKPLFIFVIVLETAFGSVSSK